MLFVVPMMGIPGLMIFGVADIPLSFLPKFHGDNLSEIGAIYGLVWPLFLIGVYIAAANRVVPEKWKQSPKSYKTLYMVILTVVMSIILALPFHIYASWKSH